MNFKGKVAVSTGAAVGIGRGTALAFADQGASVALLDFNQAGAEETAAMVRQTGAKCLSLRYGRRHREGSRQCIQAD
jgi:NAD(P)-dependent dehydrogenase (short-subunit alcohol dehydrogenase family)